MAIKKGTGIKLTESEAVVGQYFTTSGENMNLDIVQRAAITREQCYQEIESRFGTADLKISRLVKNFRVGQLISLDIDPETLQVR